MTTETIKAGADASTRVLVVDDSAVIRQALKKMLAAEFDVVMAEHGESGWSRLAEDGQVKLLITDIEMPHLDGYGLICRLRASEDARIRELPIIAITGAEDEGTKVRAYACGANDFITKPLDKAQLLRSVQAYVGFDELASRPGEDQLADPLTGLAGRQQFRQRGEQLFARARQQGQDLALVRVDIDDFKQLYKQCGDELFDQLLVWLSRLLAEGIRADDLVARVGGTEFALLLPGCSLVKARTICQELLERVHKQAFASAEGSVRVTLSIGVAAVGEAHTESFEDLLRIVDERLHHAKSEGGDRVSEIGLGETLEQPEEVVLAEPEAELGEPMLEEMSEEISLSGLDDVEFMPTPVENGVNGQPDEELLRLLSVDRALMLLAQGEHARIDPYLDVLVQQLLPLLEYYRDQSERVPALVDDILRRFRNVT